MNVEIFLEYGKVKVQHPERSLESIKVTDILLFKILEKLEEIYINQIDIEANLEELKKIL